MIQTALSNKFQENQRGPVPFDWRSLQRQNFTKLEKLADFLQLSENQKRILLATPPFPLNLPKRLAEKIIKGTLDDPLLMQFLPLGEELDAKGGFTSAPVQDEKFRQSSRLLHKYRGRALLLVTGACAMHCRYCFRQNFPYPKGGDLQEEMLLIENDPTLSEVILSGGDPLSLGDGALSKILQQLGAISHIKRVRFHTRFPVGIPERVTPELLQILQMSRLQIWFVVHINHPKELDVDVRLALKKVRLLGIPVLNQAVLLKGINDSVEVLSQLSEQLADEGIAFYYLHQLDQVSGAHRFHVAKSKGIELIEQLRSRVSGYGVPTYVSEIPGQPAKTPISIA